MLTPSSSTASLRGWRVLALLLTLTTAVHAADWRPVTQTQQPPARYFVDLSNVEFGQQSVVVWSMAEFGQPQRTREGNAYVRETAQTKYDCARRTSRPLRSIAYAADGTVVVDHTYGPSADRPVRPGTIDAQLLRYVCR